MFKKIILDLPIMYLAPEIKSRNLSPTDLTKYCVNRMEKFNPLFKGIHYSRKRMCFGRCLLCRKRKKKEIGQVRYKVRNLFQS